MNKILIKDAMAVVTLNHKGDVLKDCDILLSDNRIEKVGKDLEIDATEDIHEIDGKLKVVLPGFINCHHHLYQVLTRNLPVVQNAPLFEWLVYLYDIWKYLTPEDVYISAKAGISELLLSGCTTTTDHFYVFPKGVTGELIDCEIEAARECGIRFAPSRGSMSRGRSKGGLPPDEVVQKEEEILKDCERLINRYHDPSPLSMTRILLAPCSPFSVTRELLELTREMAHEKGIRLHTHLAETENENDYCLSTYGMRPLDFMKEVGWFGESVSFAHGIHFTEDEIQFLGKTKTTIVHCPTSNLRLGSGIAPIPRLLKAGANVALGVDGSASNDSSCMLYELRQTLLIHRISSGVSSMPAMKVFEMASKGGAKCLGLDEIGSIEEGMGADLSLFDLSGIEFSGSLSDPATALLFCGISGKAHTVIVNGRIVVQDHSLKTVDEKDVTRKANESSKRLLERAGVRV